MQGIYTHIPEKNYVPREYSVAAVLLFLFMVLISLVSMLDLLYFYISTFRSVCAVPNMAVFCSSLTSWFPGMLLLLLLLLLELQSISYSSGNCYYFLYPQIGIVEDSSPVVCYRNSWTARLSKMKAVLFFFET